VVYGLVEACLCSGALCGQKALPFLTKVQTLYREPASAVTINGPIVYFIQEF
jgi:hypothetical protein